VLQYWSNASALSFEERSANTTADIQLNFYVGDHGDSQSFDGPGGVLAHAFNPSPGMGGDVHWDGSESWTIDSGDGKNYIQLLG